ncbi:MAG: hypothetical protein ACFB6S_18405 [Geminicoccaceae bacterium]
MTVSPLIFGIAFVCGTIGIALAAYFLTRLVARSAIQQETRDLAASITFRVAALHGLILALVFAQELERYTDLHAAVVQEATAVADIYNDIRRYGTDREERVQAALSRYVRIVVGHEWDRLGTEARLSPDGWNQRERIYIDLLNLTPATARQDALRSHMLDDIQLIASLRQGRENVALKPVGTMFWVAAVSGVVLVAMPYFVFAPTFIHLFLLSVYGGFSGIVMLLIFAFSNPFAPPGNLSPTAFERLLETEIGATD